jgi:hypothetical protein
MINISFVSESYYKNGATFFLNQTLQVSIIKMIINVWKAITCDDIPAA